MGLTYEQARSLGLAHLWPEPEPAPAAPPAESRAPRPIRNKLEESFWGRVLEARDRRLFTHCYWEPFTLRLAGRTTYRPDCLTITAPGGFAALQWWEVKGSFAREDSLVKLKVAAELYPWMAFHLVTREKWVWTCRHVADRGISNNAWTPDWLA